MKLYETIVTLLLVNGMSALTEKERPDAIKYMTRALNDGTPVIYNYATVLFTYFFLTENQACEENGNEEIIRTLAWGGLQFIAGRMAAGNGYTGSEKSDEIRNLIKKALEALEASEKWFGEDGFWGCAEKSEDYMEWLALVDCGVDHVGACDKVEAE